jgi:hypothetical protein
MMVVLRKTFQSNRSSGENIGLFLLDNSKAVENDFMWELSFLLLSFFSPSLLLSFSTASFLSSNLI